MFDIENLNKKIPENFPFELKEYKFPQENPLSECKCNENHIGGWYIDEKLCDDLKDYFWSKKQLHRIGIVGNFEIHQDVKKSTDLVISNRNVDDPVFKYRLYLQSCLDLYFKKYTALSKENHGDLRISSNYMLQYYKPGEGFYKEHCERSSKMVANRVLAFMTYLNDVDDGGTEFKYQGVITPAKKGLTFLWPVDWTHTHKGQISESKDKYIITGWYNFD